MKFKQDKKRMGNRNCPGQHHIYQELFPYYSRIFHTFLYLWSFSRLFKALKISKIFSKLLQDLYEPCTW